MKKLKAKLIFAISLILVAGAVIATLIVLGNNHENGGGTSGGEGTSESSGVTLPSIDLGNLFN